MTRPITSRLTFMALLAFCLLAAAPDASAQQRRGPSQAELEKRKKKKVADPFLKNARWITDYDEARAKAKELDKVLFVYFSRSYAP